ncbi:MAG: alpha/beta hydrolase [Acidimicrobiales bacterium]
MRPGSTYLAASAVGALATANAYRPASRTGGVSLAAFASGVVTSELPFLNVAGHGLATAGMAIARRKGLRSPAGKLGLALSAASSAGLVGLHREAQRSRETLESALVDELGADYRKRMAEAFAPPADIAFSRRQVLLPTSGLRRRYGSVRNLSYGEFGRRNRLDIWRRADLPADAAAPVLLQVHGGAWVMGQKEGQGHPLMGHLADRGWVCVTINYRLSPRATWPDHIVDVKRAIAWVRANIAEHGGDPDFLTITGGSAGGHLSSLAALSANDPAFQPGFEEADTTVQAAVPFYGVYDFTNRDATGRADLADFLAARVFKTSLADDTERWDQASPMSRVRADAPPFFILHGTNDSLVPIEQARAFADLLRKESTNPVVFAELARAQHAFDVFGSIRATHAARAVDRFLAVVRSDQHQSDH